MITEDYISFETAKLLKEKGFDEDIDLWYDENGDTFFKYHYEISRDWRIRQNQQVYQRPTLQMAMKWLREVHNLSVEVQFFLNEENDTSSWNYNIIDIITYCNKAKYDICINFKTYEEACEAAIKYCLENLI